MELVIPNGKFKDRKIGSLTLEEAQSVATAVAGTAFGKAAQARVDTLKALEAAPAAVQEVNGALDLEAAK
jgi:formylmethanofuran:tetrahydromethanopterin formyltransferase